MRVAVLVVCCLFSLTFGQAPQTCQAVTVSQFKCNNADFYFPPRAGVTLSTGTVWSALTVERSCSSSLPVARAQEIALVTCSSNVYGVQTPGGMIIMPSPNTYLIFGSTSAIPPLVATSLTNDTQLVEVCKLLDPFCCRSSSDPGFPAPINSVLLACLTHAELFSADGFIEGNIVTSTSNNSTNSSAVNNIVILPECEPSTINIDTAHRTMSSVALGLAIAALAMSLLAVVTVFALFCKVCSN